MQPRQLSVHLDVRGLEPPEPMTRILEAIHELQEGTVLLARTDRKPLFLLEVLLERNLTHRSEMCADGTWLTEIAR